MRALAVGALVILLLIAAIAPWQTLTGAFTDWTRATTIEQLLLLRPTLNNLERLLFPERFVGQSANTSLFRTWWVNSFILASTVAVLQSIVSVTTGYALARYRFAGRELLLALMIARNIVPGSVLFIPTYIVLRRLGLTGLTGMIVPGIVSAGTVIMTRQFALGLASEVFEAASIDGANDWQMLRHIALPMLTPMIGMTFAGAFAGAWNNLLWANIMLRGMNQWITVQGVLYMMTQLRLPSGRPDYGLISAAALVSLALPVTIFILLQRYVEAGMEGILRE